MKSRQNITDIEITKEGLTIKVVRFSYQTPVAVELLEPVITNELTDNGDDFVEHQTGIYVTDQYHSPTTSKHVNQFIYHPSRADKGGSVRKISPAMLAALIYPVGDSITLLSPGSTRG